MQPGNHIDTSVSPYPSASTSELHPGVVPAFAGGPTVHNPQAAPPVTDAQVAPPTSCCPRVESGSEGNGRCRHDRGDALGRSNLGQVVPGTIDRGALFVAAWVVLATATWGLGYSNLTILTYISGAAILLFGLLTALKIFRTIHSHHYRLTMRRLFIRTGLIHRRIDQIELLRVKDVFVRQSLLGKWIGVGHVVILSSEHTLPRATLYGIDRPRHVMDLIWLRTRAELDQNTARVDQV